LGNLANGTQTRQYLPRKRRGNLNGNLVGHHLKQRLVFGNVLAWGDEPRQNLTFGNAFAYIRQAKSQPF
jgi:hypothetical protein